MTYAAAVSSSVSPPGTLFLGKYTEGAAISDGRCLYDSARQVLEDSGTVEDFKKRVLLSLEKRAPQCPLMSMAMTAERGSIAQYLETAKKCGSYGGAPELLTICNMFARSFWVYNDDGAAWIQFQPDAVRVESGPACYLRRRDHHYTPLLPVSRPPAPQCPQTSSTAVPLVENLTAPVVAEGSPWGPFTLEQLHADKLISAYELAFLGDKSPDFLPKSEKQAKVFEQIADKVASISETWGFLQLLREAPNFDEFARGFLVSMCRIWNNAPASPVENEGGSSPLLTAKQFETLKRLMPAVDAFCLANMHLETAAEFSKTIDRLFRHELKHDGRTSSRSRSRPPSAANPMPQTSAASDAGPAPIVKPPPSFSGGSLPRSAPSENLPTGPPSLAQSAAALFGCLHGRTSMLDVVRSFTPPIHVMQLTTDKKPRKKPQDLDARRSLDPGYWSAQNLAAKRNTDHHFWRPAPETFVMVDMDQTTPVLLSRARDLGARLLTLTSPENAQAWFFVAPPDRSAGRVCEIRQSLYKLLRADSGANNRNQVGRVVGSAHPGAHGWETLPIFFDARASLNLSQVLPELPPTLPSPAKPSSSPASTVVVSSSAASTGSAPPPKYGAPSFPLSVAAIGNLLGNQDQSQAAAAQLTPKQRHWWKQRAAQFRRSPTSTPPGAVEFNPGAGPPVWGSSGAQASPSASYELRTASL